MNTPIDQMEEINKGFFGKLILSDKKIGDLNGKWAAAFKILIILLFLSIPTVIMWGTWITNKAYNLESHIELTEDYGPRLQHLEKKAHEADLRDVRINNIEHKVDKTGDDVVQLEKANATDHTSILVLLEQIKTKLELFMDTD